MEDSDDLSRQLEATLQRFIGLVRSVGRKKGLDVPELDELTQAIRVRLWRALRDGETIAAVTSSYMYQTAMTAAIDLVRSRRDHRKAPGDPEAILLRESAPERPDAELEAGEEMERIVRALDQIPPDRRVAVKLYLSGYAGQEISTMLKWSRARTRNLIYRGLEDLRLRMKGMEL